ncbi:hypothetical protein NMG60_11012123 [Bertholletia excelsa]
MEGEIDADAPLDYAEFQLFPAQDRYDVCICKDNVVEQVSSGSLGQLMVHLPEPRDLCSKGSHVSFKLQPTKTQDTSQWFIKATILRFLRIVGSTDILNGIHAIENEISQLEEARKFHLSLYTKGDVEIVSSDASKNELLRAMDLRLTALRGELAAAFNRAAGATCSLKHISDMEKFSQHVGAMDLRSTLHKFIELSQTSQIVDLPCHQTSASIVDLRNDVIKKTEENFETMKPSCSDTPVKYGVSPAKVAEVERQSSTESEESSYSSEDDQPSVERSRTLARSASPRRSASPMRRVQIGRSGSRRPTALTIRSLSYLPAKDRTLSHRDATANYSDEEGSEQPTKKSDTNVRRMSVQDAISLFESKQRDQKSDVQKIRSTLDAFSGTNKSVLRRWSAGMGENSAPQPLENVSESPVPVTYNNFKVVEDPMTSKTKPEFELLSGDDNPVETAKADADISASVERMPKNECSQAENPVTERQESTENLTASAEWNRQKEAELNQMLMKMMESKQMRSLKTEPDNNRRPDVQRNQRGGVYDHYKEKRNEKLRQEAAGKRAEKEAQFRAMQQILKERKTEMASANRNDVRRKSSPAKPQKPQKSVSHSANPKKDSSKPAAAKKALAKSSSIPATRKSWPSAPSPRTTTRISPAKTTCGSSSASTTPTRRKLQPPSSVPPSSTKAEKSMQRPNTLKASQNDTTRKNMKAVNEKLQQPLTKNGKTAKTKALTNHGKDPSVAATKPCSYSKVTKKSSVVPLESKPFLRKGSGIGPGVGSVVVKTKTSSQPEETQRKPANMIQAHENEQTDTTGPVSLQKEEDFEQLETPADLESESNPTSQLRADDTVCSEQVTANGDDSFLKAPDCPVKTEVEEESIISPTAWVEIEELQDSTILPDDSTCRVASVTNVAAGAISSPRVRHSLSQMLLEESAEHDIIEWGNAENPPAMVYQKDAPKGLKRLLKFARKSKADPNSTGWSSPSVFSEGEDDSEESKTVSKKNGDILLKKAAVHSKNYGLQKSSLLESFEKNSFRPETLSAQANINDFSAQSSSRKLQDHISFSTASSTTKETRSFFSFSAFRGGKPN